MTLLIFFFSLESLVSVFGPTWNMEYHWTYAANLYLDETHYIPVDNRPTR